MLSAFDHERQAALKDATRFLDRFTQRELTALDLRVESLLGDPGTRDIDDPFSASYVLDAIGASARAVYPNPRVWRPFMERVLTDITPDLAFECREGKVYYLNGHLPVFIHDCEDLQNFRFFSSQLVTNGNATQSEIARAFGVPLVTVKRYVKLDRECGAKAFYVA